MLKAECTYELTHRTASIQFDDGVYVDVLNLRLVGASRGLRGNATVYMIDSVGEKENLATGDLWVLDIVEGSALFINCEMPDQKATRFREIMAEVHGKLLAEVEDILRGPDGEVHEKNEALRELYGAMDYDAYTMAQCFRDHYGENFLYVPKVGWHWYSENTGTFSLDEIELIHNRIRNFTRELAPEARIWMGEVLGVPPEELLHHRPSDISRRYDDKLKQLKEGEDSSESTRLTTAYLPARNFYTYAYQSIENAEKAAKSLSGLDGMSVNPDQLDNHALIIPCINGYINLVTGELMNFGREYQFTKATNVTYDPRAECPNFKLFIRQVMGEISPFATLNEPGEINPEGAEMVEYIQRLFGYLLTGDTRADAFFFMHGGGANGKSLLLRVISEILGDYAMWGTSGLVTRTRQDPHPTERADLRGRRVAIVDELGEGKTLDDEFLKQVTGGQSLKARHMGKDFFEFPARVKIIIASNPKPSVLDMSDAIWSRLHLIPFEGQWNRPDQPGGPVPGLPMGDPGLINKLRAEYSGILAWAVRGTQAFLRDGLKPPAVVREATVEYRQEHDVIGQFIESELVIDRESNPVPVMTTEQLYPIYETWARGQGFREKNILTKRQLSVELRASAKRFGYEPCQIGQRRHKGYRGLRQGA